MGFKSIAPRFVLAAILGAAPALCGCGVESESAEERLGSAEQELMDADSRAFAVRAAVALLGRPPLDTAELAAFTNAMGNPVDPIDQRRNALLDCMMGSDAAPVCVTAREAFTRHWTMVLMDILKVSRRNDGDRTNAACWANSGLAGTLSAAQRATQEVQVAGFVATNATNAAPPVGVPANFTMLDVLRGSVEGDLRSALRGNLFAQMMSPAAGNQISETNTRANYWTRFESSYLNRQQLCLSCHNTEFSVAGSPSDWNRHAPTPHKVEKATIGCSNGECAEPPDLHADFRFEGFAGTCNAAHQCTPGFPGGERPWGMVQPCGEFNVNPSSQTTCPPEPADPLNPTDPAALAYVCFKDASLQRRAPAPQFGANGSMVTGSVYRLDQMLVAGAASLAGTAGDIGADSATVRDVGVDGSASAGSRGFAIMAAANVVERIWEEIFGSRLTLALHYPRVPSQRDVLYSLTRDLLKPVTGTPWSLRFLLKRILLRPEFNAAAREGDEFQADIVWNPWVLHDPRPAPLATERCATNTPTFEGCVRELLQKDRCVNCHENPEKIPSFSHDNYQAMVDRSLSAAACTQLATDPGCLATSINCNDIANKPGGKIAVLVSCTKPTPSELLADPAAPGRRMPRGLAPIPDADRTAIVKWVTNGGPQGTRPPDEPPPNNDPGPVTHNGIGDMVHWKSPFQLSFGMGAALGLDPWAQLVPGSGTAAYPSREVAEVAGHYLDDSIVGGRGLSLLGLLAWERAHKRNGELCRFGAGPDAIDGLVQAGASVESILGALKQRFMGESELGVEESGLLATVVGVPLATVVGASNAPSINGGVRRACNVFMKSPLFMLSYVEPTPGTLMSVSRGLVPARPRDPEKAMILPELCGGRLDCRQVFASLDDALGDCWRRQHTCRSRRGRALTAEVETTLADLRLPVEKPALDLAHALIEEPAAVPSANDPRLQSNLLVLPLGGGKVLRRSGYVKGFFRGHWRMIDKRDHIHYGEVLFFREHAQFKVQVGADVYATGPKGMEKPPLFADVDDDPRDDDDDDHDHDQGRRWVVLCNGPEAQSAPPPAGDPRISIGDPHGTPADMPMVGSRPVWAQYGEGGLWYVRP